VAMGFRASAGDESYWIILKIAGSCSHGPSWECIYFFEKNVLGFLLPLQHDRETLVFMGDGSKLFERRWSLTNEDPARCF